MKPEKGKYYLVTLLDGTRHRVKFKGEDPGNVLKFEKKDGTAFSVPTGGFTDMKED
jgi:hypothetical protein